MLTWTFSVLSRVFRKRPQEHKNNVLRSFIVILWLKTLYINIAINCFTSNISCQNWFQIIDVGIHDYETFYWNEVRCIYSAESVTLVQRRRRAFNDLSQDMLKTDLCSSSLWYVNTPIIPVVLFELVGCCPLLYAEFSLVPPRKSCVSSCRPQIPWKMHHRRFSKKDIAQREKQRLGRLGDNGLDTSKLIDNMAGQDLCRIDV